ncbi:MAG: 16S rRNA (guanine(527)-N(7))-methyltransferase RsmG [Treponema sp.]|jgi:16S rRNA (guanine527-N7)-methyltransferase|nr:16S rRNA (guanine(527)-N(7))-methyltransferase RsmG [Treponema sp.]
MKDIDKFLCEGIEILRKSDEELNRLISARSDEILSLLAVYINEIEFFNRAYGLVGTEDRQELIIKHILDSLSPAGIISRLLTEKNTGINIDSHHGKGIKMADAGSGAGLPGIPLAITMPSSHFTLIERMGRRAGFLLNTIAALSLSNITVTENELEKTNGSFDLITFRAFKPLEPKLFRTLRKLCAPSGIIAAYKGKREKIEMEITAMTANNKQEIAWDWEIIPYTVPFLNEERHLLVIKF